MLLQFDDNQMLAIWREAAGLEPRLSEGSVERFDGYDVNQQLLTAMRAWYIDYLSTAPLETVPESDLTEYARLSAGPASDQWTLRLSCQTARITEIQLEGKGRVALINPENPDNREILHRLGNRFVRQGRIAKALHRQGTDTATIMTGDKETPVLKTVKGVRITDDDLYIVDERMLTKIAPYAAAAIAPPLYNN